MQEQFDAVVGGHICLDIIPTIESRQIRFLPGRLVEIGRACLSIGGPVSNTGLALHKLGLRIRLMGKISNDLFGQVIGEIITSHTPSLTEGMIQVAGEVSSYTIILSPQGADRMFLHCPGCNDTFTADDIDYDMLEQAQLFHFGYPPVMKRMIEQDGAELSDLFRRAKAKGVTTSLDMTMPDPSSFSGSVNWPVILSATLPYVDIFLPSLEEILFTLYPDNFDGLSKGSDHFLSLVTPELVVSVGEDLLSMGPKVVGLKLGHMGLYLRTADKRAWLNIGRAKPHDPTFWVRRELWSPCFRTQVVGTTGAGDATIAGFLAALLRGLTPEEAVTMACAVGACNVEAADALGGVRTWSETGKRIACGWPRAPLPFEMVDWHHGEKAGLWYGPNDAAIGHKNRTGG